MPTNNELIDILKRERVTVLDQRTLFEQNAADATKRLNEIDAAVSALGGIVVKKSSAPSVTDIVEAAARSTAKGATFDNAALRRLATAMYPAEADKIKTGVYNAVQKLMAKKVIVKAPGGYQLVPI